MTKLESGAARVLIQADRLDQIHCKKKRQKKKKKRRRRRRRDNERKNVGKRQPCGQFRTS